MSPIRAVIFSCLTLALGACSGSELSIESADGDVGTIGLSFPPGRAAEHQLPFNITGGIPPYHARIEGCPDWATLFPDQGILAGTAPAGDVGETFFCSYQVTDSTDPDPQSGSRILRLVVGSLGDETTLTPLRVSAPAARGFIVNTFYSVTLPAASGGVGPYTYALTCAGGELPPGMGFVPETRVLAGTPSEGFRDSCAYTVSDSSRPAEQVSKPIQLAVFTRPPPALTVPSAADQDLVVGVYRSITLPAAEGGLRPYRYSFTCPGGRLPAGMGFAPETRVLAGTPSTAFRDSCVYSVTDSSSPVAKISQPVQLTVLATPPPALTMPSTGDHDLVAGDYRAITLPAAVGGLRPYRYSFTCAGGRLPTGMGFARQTRVLAGTPNAAFRDSCAYAVTDSSNPVAQVSQPVQLTVLANPPPPLTVPTLPDQELSVGIYRTVVFPAASGGLRPYEYALTCAGRRLPSGMGFASETRVLAGSPNAAFRDSCVYTVTDSSNPATKVSRPVQVTVVALDLGTWRFRTRTLERSDHAVTDTMDTLQTFVTLPHALPEAGEERGTERYELLDIQSPLEFEPSTRELSYRHTGVAPIFGTPTTFRYQVYSADNDVQDALCVDVSFHDFRPKQPGPDGVVDTAAVWVRDDAYWDAAKGEYRCPDAARSQTSSARATVSNPVHTALAPLHARRAVATAHAAVRDRVRDWSRGAPLAFAVSPAVEFGSLSGESGGFDYTGSSESLTGSVELGAGSWQAGVVASFTRTGLDYRAAASLAGRGYRVGEHETEIVSAHPFAAWHTGFGGKLWASLGAGTGDLRHRDDLGFPSPSRSDVRLSSYGVGASVPLADMLSGELGAEAGIDGFAFEIEGGGQISTSLPTLRGRDYRAGLAWSAPVLGTPHLSVAYKQLTGDGPEGAQVETRGSASVEGFLDPRLTLEGNAEATFGLGGYGHDSWQLGGGLHFAPDRSGRGLDLDLDARAMSPADGSEAGVGVRGEAGYGLPGVSPLGIVRPYLGLTRYPGSGSIRRAVGLDLLDTPTSRLSLEFHHHSRDRSRAAELTLRHRF